MSAVLNLAECGGMERSVKPRNSLLKWNTTCRLVFSKNTVVASGSVIHFSSKYIVLAE
ncbi:uncharacterized protein PHALS_06750 [Plasmopara halstedii]|uniref:Uncharacterized protein n=1 Tax=Plasmopara halstedii TaxID=4781 RepID=A0A0P1B3P7_PLAHL|nr:uncharacterized protein PHALS_06750 [Plasmopara halstedii]CEG48960.1 hypothetical protein PHALS_06750 [Plasmopara halstedii]|eukprot:XP_024585329.1 hypothetical protein PHALS_06750 [Plasmopara halstedii]